MTSTIDPATTLGDLVTSHPDLASELERRSLDYCCGGTRTLAEACSAQGLDPTTVIEELAAVATAEPASWADLGAAELVDHLEGTHHAYLHTELPRIEALSAKVRSVHGANHSEPSEVDDLFQQLRAELDPHLAKEERILFPMIRQLVTAEEQRVFHCGSLQKPISQMLREHDHAGALLERLHEVTDGYAVPADGCASYRALYRALDDLESDTHLHVHIENNRLFPMAVELERRRSQ